MVFDDNRIQMRKHLAQIVCVFWRYCHRVLPFTKTFIQRVPASRRLFIR